LRTIIVRFSIDCQAGQGLRQGQDEDEVEENRGDEPPLVRL